MKVTLRPADQADFDFCFQAKREALGPHIDARWGWDEAFQLRFHRQRWSERPWFIILAGAETVGTVSIQWNDAHVRFGEFYLLAAFQRQGIGTHVLQSVLQEADAKGLPVKLEYLKWNPVGSLYKRHGFEVVEENDIHYFLVRQPVNPPLRGLACGQPVASNVKPHTSAPTVTRMDTVKLLEVLEVYFDAFAEHDPSRRGELVAQCLTPDCAIWGHSQVYAGHAAISEKIAGFHTNFPDCRLVLASGLMTFENVVRFANAIVRRDGSVVARGETVAEIAPDGRLCRIVPLWETNLPPMPESWPAHLAVQPLPKVSDAA